MGKATLSKTLVWKAATLVGGSVSAHSPTPCMPINMSLVIGPVLRHADGYAFDAWTAGKGVTRSYPYHRIEHAYYARNAEIKASARGRAPAAIVCQTLDELIVKLTGDEYPIDNVYLPAKNPWLQRQLHTPLGLGDRPFVVGRRPVAGEGLPPRQPDLMLDDTGPFRLSRNHFIIEQRHEGYYVRDLRSTLGTIVNGQPIGDHCCTDDVLLRAVSWPPKMRQLAKVEACP
jgi:hypothetical protein